MPFVTMRLYSRIPQSQVTIKKKHNSIAYHRTQEAVASGMIRIAWKDGGQLNLADVLPKLLAGPQQKDLISCILD